MRWSGDVWAHPGSFLGFPLKGYRLHFQIGLFASYRLMQLVVPDMIELGRGGIVNISSLAAFVPGPGPYEHPGGPTVLAYGGNKAALHHLTQAVAFEVASVKPGDPKITLPGFRVTHSGHWFAQNSTVVGIMHRAFPDFAFPGVSWEWPSPRSRPPWR